MPEITLNGVVVQFPFKPYKIQEDYMAKVIECLQNNQNGVLESPTGTGKTLSLLCSSLAWLMVKRAQQQMHVQCTGASNQLKENKFVRSLTDIVEKGAGKCFDASINSNDKLAIIYVSRTHAQLSQAVKELKGTSYNHFNVVVLGSREQLCIHPEVSLEKDSSTKIHMCQAKIMSSSCIFYENYKKEIYNTEQNILDIEDLVKTTQKIKLCPYFLSKELKNNADVIFMPYNYLLDHKMRIAQGINLNNKIVLIDEAHHVEQLCERASSLEISSTDIALCIDEVTAAMKKLANETNSLDDSSSQPSTNLQKNFSPDDLCVLKAMFLELEKAIDNIKINEKSEGEILDGDYIFDLLGKVDITSIKSRYVTDKLKKIILYLMAVNETSVTKKGNALKKFCDLLHILFFDEKTDLYRQKIKSCYKVYIQREKPKKSSENDVWKPLNKTKSNGKLICFWCFSAEFAMQQLLKEGVKSIILTSGTLSPIKQFISEMGIKINVQLENAHIISDKQISVAIMENGYDGYCLNSSYNTRNDPKYIASLGESMKILSCILPQGLLVFFPSYPVLKTCQEQWQISGKWAQIESYKPIFVESQSSNIFKNIIKEYYAKIQDSKQKGAILMGVCRGKISEGIDFANENGRAVMITGLPFPPLKDPRVMLKQKYLDENRSKGKDMLTGQAWYQLQASRAVNQAVGRIIRHKNDYGVVLLCDSRFNNPSLKQQLSKWIRPHVKTFPKFDLIMKELREFFKYTEFHIPLPTVPAQFDTGNNSSIKSNVKVMDLQFKSQDDFDIDIYKIETNDNNEKKKKEINSKSSDFSKLLEFKSETIANLRTCKFQNINKPSQETSTITQPVPKRKKFNLKPIQFEVDEPAQTKKQVDGRNYLQEVKRSISEENYNIFGNILIKYKKNEINFDELLNNLKKIFIIDHQKQHLLIGYRTYLKKKDLKEFDSYIEAMKK